MSYDRSMTGALFKNEDKREGKKDADYRGSCEMNGHAYWIDAWLNTSQKGVKYLALKFKEKGGEKIPRPPKAPGEVKGFDDSIPFSEVGRVTDNAQSLADLIAQSMKK